jgi:hypothetical protein
MPAKEPDSRNICVKHYFWKINMAAMMEKKYIKNHSGPHALARMSIYPLICFSSSTYKCFFAFS